MGDNQTSTEDPRRYWREKLDEHEKSINTLLMALAGGLLAFSADYVKDLVAHLGSLDRILAGAAIAGASVSIATGGLRAWLRTRLYGAELTSIDLEQAEGLYKQIEKSEDEWAAKAAENVRQAVGITEQDRAAAVGKAIADVYALRGDALLHEAKTVLSLARQQKGLRRMEQLMPLQIISFLLGVLAVAAMVFRQLAA